jgi:GH24 family phage-related lysozyme (muramidase)
MTTQEWQQDFAARLMHNEGFRLRMYLDSMGIPTIGCGFNLDRPDWAQGLVAAGVAREDTPAVKAGTLGLTVPQVGALLNYSDEPIIPQARAILQTSHFDNMSDARRAAFADLDFNLGQEGLGEFARFVSLVDLGCHYIQTGRPTIGHTYFGQAADDLEATAYASQVGARAKRNGEMLRTSNYVAIDAFELT